MLDLFLNGVGVSTFILLFCDSLRVPTVFGPPKWVVVDGP